MTFLKKLGQGIVKGLQIAGRIEGVLGPELPADVRAKVDAALSRANSELVSLGAIITQVEAIGVTLKLEGTQKLTAATPLVAQMLLSSPLLLGKHVANPELFEKAAQEYAQATVDLLNSLEG